MKIQIKSWLHGSVLFEYEKEDNTIRDTVIEALKQDANLDGANLKGANLNGANLNGAKWGEIEIDRMVVFTGLYNYAVICIISKDGQRYVKMGCHFRTLEEWQSDFWNNPIEFPNNGSEKSRMRVFAFQCAEKWFDVVNPNI